MTNRSRSTHIGATAALFCGALCLALLVAPRAGAQSLQGARPDAPAAPMEWQAWVGAQNRDAGRQALAFLPNELWVHAGDSIKWHFNADDIHTVSFLKVGQLRYPFFIGCPGYSNDPAVFDGSACVTSNAEVEPGTFTVFFPSANNFKLVCLVHENMTAVVHVLPLNQPLPHDQEFYTRAAQERARELLSDKDHGKHTTNDDGHAMHDGGPHADVANKHNHGGKVIAGIGEIEATAGGTDTLSVLRFERDTIVIHRGETVEWDNMDPVTPHTITFGDEPPGDPSQPSPDVALDPDGARHAIIDSTSDSTHSGFIQAGAQDQAFEIARPMRVTRFRVTFPNVGVFPYICALHDELGMTGKVIVVP